MNKQSNIGSLRCSHYLVSMCCPELMYTAAPMTMLCMVNICMLQPTFNQNLSKLIIKNTAPMMLFCRETEHMNGQDLLSQ